MILPDTSLLVANGAIDAREGLAVSVVSIGELQVGVLAAANGQLRRERLSRLTGIVENASVLAVGPEVADAYATLRAAVGRQPTNDLWIAATAVAHGLELVTGDWQQSRLPGVRARYVEL